MIQVLGTGSADGWPNPFCRCASCSSARALGVIRAQTSVLLDDFMLDFGPDTARSAERAGVSLDRVRHVLLTHNHPDHTAPAFLLYRSWVTGDATLDVIGPPSVIAHARMWLPPDTPVTFYEVVPGDVLDLAGGRVRVLEAAHDDDAVLYDVAAPSGRVFYATDTGPLPSSTVAATTGAAYDVVFLEQTFGHFTAHGTAHLDLPSFADQLRRLRAVRAVVDSTEVIAVHLSHHNPPLPELERQLASYGARVVPDGSVISSGAAQTTPVTPEVLRTLVIGGARSGKSLEAERMLAAEDDVTYVATSYPRSDDPEWVERVTLHQRQRPAHWTTLETLDLTSVLSADGGPLLIDCLTLWLTRILDRHNGWDDHAWESGAADAVAAEVNELVHAWRSTRRRVVAVTNEVGQGLVPAERSLRRFRDEMGRLNAAIAAVSDEVRFCVAGRVIPV
ncbi:bifunctional adenosylcobinamide kinase/adenosylcobinamide-phosphate guanylyltransferase [Cumulibacter soli]|uniref:bifunctional adenosylcobinamide kinase/adenosylcobinamide-phosphate guanylyltransferase n=1 Tax=Cumulibacter soli TaxID=2546344 RepID=UPI001067755C|nr:bifunctional adenosylcobinamide kinase/adenosylcobinamide-phosphate guanylyltransferase [Cumulibacter soli]